MQQHVGHRKVVVKLRLTVLVEGRLSAVCVHLVRNDALPLRLRHHRKVRVRNRRLRRQRDGDQSRQDDQSGKQHFRDGADQRRAPRCAHGLRRHRSLYHEKIRAPVAKRKDKTQSHHQPKPFDAEPVGVRMAEADPRVRETRVEPGLQPRPASHVFQANPGERQESRNDQKKLHYFIVNGAR